MLTKRLLQQLEKTRVYATQKHTLIIQDLYNCLTNYCLHNHLDQTHTINLLLNEALENRLAPTKTTTEKKANTENDHQQNQTIQPPTLDD